MAPDHDIEQFWLSFKKSMDNFYSVSEHRILRRPIEKWSDCLNGFQAEKKYGDIEEHIKEYISLYAMDLLRVGNSYYIDILATNIKRWNKIAGKYDGNFEVSDEYYNCVFMLLDVWYSLVNGRTDDMVVRDLFSNYELCILDHDYSVFINYAMTYEKVGLLDKLLKYDYGGTLNVIGVEDEKNGRTWTAKRLIGRKN